MKESDWKVFKKIKVEAVDRFCTQVLDELASTIADSRLSAHERYLSVYRLIDERNEAMAKMFDGHSRSTAFMQLLLMNAAGVADESLLAELSPELRQSIQPASHSV